MNVLEGGVTLWTSLADAATGMSAEMVPRKNKSPTHTMMMALPHYCLCLILCLGCRCVACAVGEARDQTAIGD